MTNWLEQEAINETTFREMNEFTVDAQDLDAAFEDPSNKQRYLCECSNSRCTDPISLTRREYESVRSARPGSPSP
ncbi:MAG: hypothetical protein QOE83_944 [Actinomycetota bacterium]|nr:hypothetical protein [Actinomycetota bacterium]